MKACPVCAAQLEDAVPKCGACGEELAVAEYLKPVAPPKKRIVDIRLLVLLALSLIALAATYVERVRSRPKAEKVDLYKLNKCQDSCREQCRQWISDLCGTPPSARFKACLSVCLSAPEETPPASQEEAPPDSQEEAPPAPQEEAPPAPQEEAPPAPQEETPPASQEGTPPAPQQETPP